MEKGKQKSGKKEFTDISTGGRGYVDMKKIKVGATFEGEVSEVVHKPKHGKFEAQEQIVIKHEDGKETGFPSHYTLNVPLLGKDNEKKGEAVGKYVRLTYNGQTDAKGKKKGVHLWKVEQAN